MMQLMRIDASTTEEPLVPDPRSGLASIIRAVDRAAVLDSVGLACYIAWSFVFWNGSLLFGSVSDAAPMGDLLAVQGAFTALTALLLVLAVRKAAPLRTRRLLLGAFSLVSSLAVVVVAFVGYREAPMEWMWLGFALSGLGSTLRLGWEERLSVRGVARTALCAGLAYLLGFVLFAIVSLLPPVVALVASALLPFGAYALLLRGMAQVPTAPEPSRASLHELLASIPWKLIVAIALAYFSYGATRMGGVMGGLAASGAGHVAVAGIPALGCLIAIALAFCFYRKNALLAFYLAFPLMGIAAIVPASVDPLGGTSTFCIALVGAELVKYLVWFLLIDSIIKDGLSALLCLALMRFAQWGGSCLGQLAADALPTQEAVTIAVLVSLVVALLVIIGAPVAAKAAAGGSAAGEASDLEARVALAAARFRLSPREEEVLAIWATGHTGAYIEKQLFISKNTVKTHLNHIYAKTKTANREELLELLEALDVE